MKYKFCMIAIAALTIMWGCSSDDSSDASQSQPEPQPQEENSLFTESEYPDWSINWKWF